jgi:hypothetical protein
MLPARIVEICNIPPAQEQAIRNRMRQPIIPGAAVKLNPSPIPAPQSSHNALSAARLAQLDANHLLLN